MPAMPHMGPLVLRVTLNGTGFAAGKHHENVRALFPMYETAFMTAAPFGEKPTGWKTPIQWIPKLPRNAFSTKPPLDNLPVAAS